MCKYDAICQKLYPYQKDILDELLANSNDDPHMHTMVYLPTGGGKTRVAAAFAILEGIFKERTIIWFAHSHHLLEQAHKAIRSLLLEIHAGKSAVIVDPFIEHNEIFIH